MEIFPLLGEKTWLQNKAKHNRQSCHLQHIFILQLISCKIEKETQKSLFDSP